MKSNTQVTQCISTHVSFRMSAKYRRVVIDEDVDRVIKETCRGIQERYEIRFWEVGTDKDHVHFLIQSVPTLIVQKNHPNSEEHYSPGRCSRNVHRK